MDDIVERLQEHGYLCCGEHYERDAYCRSCVLHAEAVAEIERLRTENAAMRRQAIQNIIHISENAGIYNHD